LIDNNIAGKDPAFFFMIKHSVMWVQLAKGRKLAVG
jgi:hypothetical protein